MVNLELRLEAAQHGDCLLDRGFFNQDRLYGDQKACEHVPPKKRKGEPPPQRTRWHGRASLTWNRLVSAASFSIVCLNSFKVVAPEICRPRARLGLSMLDASSDPSALPLRPARNASVQCRYPAGSRNRTYRFRIWWISSMKAIVSVDSSRSRMRFRIFSSNEPRTPVCSRQRLIVSSLYAPRAPGGVVPEDRFTYTRHQ